ncbi:hypothetical protein Tco_0476500, partial [Tanacetum coccineum]
HGVTAVDSYRRPPPRVRATIEDITNEPGSIKHRSEKMLLPWHDSSELERISKKKTKNEAKMTKPDIEWKSVVKDTVKSKPKCQKVNPSQP